MNQKNQQNQRLPSLDSIANFNFNKLRLSSFDMKSEVFSTSNLFTIDSFNLSRRMVWVLSNLNNEELFTKEPVNPDGGNQNLTHQLDAGQIQNLQPGTVFDFEGESFRRVNPIPPSELRQLQDGDRCLVKYPTGLEVANVRFMQGLGQPRLFPTGAIGQGQVGMAIVIAIKNE